MAIAQLAAPQAAQQTFGTPQEATQAVIDAAEHNNTAAMLKLFGPSVKDIVEHPGREASWEQQATRRTSKECTNVPLGT